MAIQELIEYCREHEKERAPKKLWGGDARHELLVSKIYTLPGEVHLPEPDLKFTEVPLYPEGRAGRGVDLLGCVDLIFVTRPEEVYLLEVKSGRSVARTAAKQLFRSYSFMKDMFGILAKRVRIVHRGEKEGFSVLITGPESKDIESRAYQKI